MGVKDLWSILSPICERKPLWELQGKSVAVDLSGWVCDCQNLTENSVQPRMYLRNLFFRTSCLLLMDVKPVFVLEGVAPALKHDTISRRNKQFCKNQSQKSRDQHVGKRDIRKRFMSILRQCRELLELMGVPCLQSQGEAEALCAQLNMAGLVDGCISQDGDCFLYGAQTVYRNFTISHSGTGGSAAYSIDVYKMTAIMSRLSLSRRKLIALSILCGCDYNEKGVVGVGKETALKFLNTVEKEDILDRLHRWCTDAYFDQLEAQRVSMSCRDLCEKCGHNGKKATHDKAGCSRCQLQQGCIQDNEGLRAMDSESRKLMLAELSLRHKALQDPQFPYQQLIDEFMASGDEPLGLKWLWEMPQLDKFVNFAMKMLAWTEDYAVEKFFPLACRWHLKHGGTMLSMYAQAIKRQCVRKGVACLEVEWYVATQWPGPLMTIEPTHLVEAKYPDLVQDFRAEKEAKRRKPKNKAKKKAVTTKGMPHVCTVGQKGKCHSHLCQFVLRQHDVAGVNSVEQQLVALCINEEKENLVPGTKKCNMPAKHAEPKVRIKNFNKNFDVCRDKESTENPYFITGNELQSWNKENNINCSCGTSLCDNNSLDCSQCSQCENDGNMDLSSIINSIVNKQNVSSPSLVSDRNLSLQTPLGNTTATEDMLSSSSCVHSTPKCFTDVNFSLGASHFLTESNDSLF